MKFPSFAMRALIICVAFGIGAGQEIQEDDPKSMFSIDSLYTEMEVSVIDKKSK